MDSTATATSASRPARVAFTSFAVEVSSVERVGENFVRVTFEGSDLEHFHAAGLDQRVKVIFPHAESGFSTFPRHSEWFPVWRSQPDRDRCTMRTYTVRRFRSDSRSLDIDFVVHGDTGPATRWARRVQPGDEVLLIGPDARTVVHPRSTLGAPKSGGVEFCAGDAAQILLAGDETAAPAICSILECLPADARGQAFIEVAGTGDIVPVAAPSGMTVTWLPRDIRPGHEHGGAVSTAVRAWTTEMVPGATGRAASSADGDDGVLWDVPEDCVRTGGIYAWIAGEAGFVTALRRHLVTEAGLDRADVAFMGYWRRGRAES